MAVAARRPQRARPLIVLLALLSISLLVVDQAGDSAPTHPVRAAVRDAFASVGDSARSLWPFDSSPSAKKLERENAALQSQLTDAQGQLAQTEDARRQARELQGLVGLETVDNVPKVVAHVTAVDSSNFNVTVELGKGSDDGIASGMPVVNGQGLVGRVIQTSGSRSTVLVIADTTSDVGVRFSDAGDIGVAVGQGLGKPVRVDLIDLNSAVKVGEIAVTSGQQHSLFPPGIPVGKVLSTDAGPQDLRRNVKLAPIVNFNTLDDVAVLKWNPKQ